MLDRLLTDGDSYAGNKPEPEEEPRSTTLRNPTKTGDF
jgi:hypothetical protein